LQGHVADDQVKMSVNILLKDHKQKKK